MTIPVQGQLADQWGRKPVLIGGTIIFLAGSALCASSWDMVSLIAFRMLQGIGAGGVQATVGCWSSRSPWSSAWSTWPSPAPCPG